MISKQKTLKLIKEKVDGRANGTIKLKKAVPCSLSEGVLKHLVRFRINKLVKSGNSVMFIDDTYKMRNINVLDTKALHQIMWQIITEKEKMEIAYNHLITSKTYLGGF